MTIHAVLDGHFVKAVTDLHERSKQRVAGWPSTSKMKVHPGMLMKTKDRLWLLCLRRLILNLLDCGIDPPSLVGVGLFALRFEQGQGEIWLTGCET